MSAHAIAWLALFVAFGALSLRRSSWAIPMYIMTFYASPNLWWWGGALKSMGSRWSLIAALVFIVATLIDKRSKTSGLSSSPKNILSILIAFAVNATFVHFAFAVAPEESWDWVDLIWKQTGLLALMIFSIRDEFDYKLLIYAIVLGGAFIGAEVIFFDAGHMHKGRLEGIRLPAGSEANHLAALLVMSAILCGFLIFFGSLKEKFIALGCAALLVETVLQCISRGVTLAAICGLAWLLVSAKGKARKYAFIAVIAGIIGAFAVMGEEHQERFFTRFSTTFASAEERDMSASGRIKFWESGLKMIEDNPFGYGGNAFKTEWARSRYLPDSDRPRSLESGYIDTAVNWGIQGFVLYFSAFVLGLHRLWRGKRNAFLRDDNRAVFLSTCIESMFVAHFVSACFNSIMKSEMCFWLLAIAICFHRIYGQPQVLDSENIETEDGGTEFDKPVTLVS